MPMQPTADAANRIRTNGVQYEHNFNNGSIWPFKQKTTRSPSSTSVVSNTLRCQWSEVANNGSRAGRGAEVRDVDDSDFAGRMYVGFKYKLPPRSATNWQAGSNQFPTNKNQMIAQVLQNNNNNTGATWCVAFDVRGNDLWLVMRDSITSNYDVEIRIDQTISRNTWHTIEYMYNPSNNGNGNFLVYYNGNAVYNGNNNINFGWGSGDRHIKFGLYCYDTSNYTNNEVRTAYYDNIGLIQRNQAYGGFGIVDPN